MTIKEKYADEIKAQLKKLNFVNWDRYVEDDNGVDVYGWIDKNQHYKDFVLIQFWVSAYSQPETLEMTFFTSSAKMSKEIALRLFGTVEGHSPCKRVEDYFDIKNSIKLSPLNRKIMKLLESRKNG